MQVPFDLSLLLYPVEEDQELLELYMRALAQQTVQSVFEVCM